MTQRARTRIATLLLVGGLALGVAAGPGAPAAEARTYSRTHCQNLLSGYLHLTAMGDAYFDLGDYKEADWYYTLAQGTWEDYDSHC